MNYFALLSVEERARFNRCFIELQQLDHRTLTTALHTGQVLGELKTILNFHWSDFIDHGLPGHLDKHKAICLINLVDLYDKYNVKYINVLEQLSIETLLYLSHPMMPNKFREEMLQMLKYLKPVSNCTIKDFEIVIESGLRTTMQYYWGITDLKELESLKVD